MPPVTSKNAWHLFPKSWISKNDTTINGGPTKSAKHTKDDLESEIVAAMINSEREFKFDDTTQLQRHVQARVDAIKASDKMVAKYSMGLANQRFGPKAANAQATKGLLIPLPGVSRLEAIESCLNSPEAVIDCTKGAFFPIQVGAMKQGDDLGNDYSHTAGTMSKEPKDKMDWVPGDRGLLRNYEGNIPENVLCLGNGRWRGQMNPPQIFTTADMQARSDIAQRRDFPATGVAK